MYGIPHGWGANVLAYNSAKVKKPTSWSVVFDPKSAYAGKITAYDSPIYIADAAMYLMSTNPSLGIKNPYSPDQKQLDAATALLKNQKKNVGEYWSDYTKSVQSFESGIHF
jgi:putative spermidine/putrescine transport system substrate-binding protein